MILTITSLPFVRLYFDVIDCYKKSKKKYLKRSEIYLAKGVLLSSVCSMF